MNVGIFWCFSISVQLKKRCIHLQSGENESDRIAILDNEEFDDNIIPSQHTIPGVIINEKPKRHFVEPVLFFLFIAFSLYGTCYAVITTF